ncbi:MAG TPA: PstS family phosphate ABC transporter substrate-binding protein [Anaerolineaceae bacterium]|nr:PstS family phosphate ABC transporter substrate-binding protein [Anaerolineaceae bacterium]
MRRFTLFAILIISALVLGACAKPAAIPTQAEPAAPSTAADLSGEVVIDGSSTVYPITVAVAEEFAAVAPDVRISVGLSGTGGGFKKFCAGETDISDASRAIKSSELELCKTAGIEFSEYLVGLDGLTVMVNPQNDWVKELTAVQLADLFGASSTIKNWSDLDASFPNEPILFFIPDPDSGTRDFMTEVVAAAKEGEEDLRSDAQTTFSSDDNVLLNGIANEKNALGFFGYAYYVNNVDKVKAVPVVNKAGVAVLPEDRTVSDGSYNPLSRPLYIYANNKALVEKPQVAAFVDYFFTPAGAQAIMASVGYSLPPAGTFEANVATLNTVLGK